jgi:hypothetical protein
MINKIMNINSIAAMTPMVIYRIKLSSSVDESSVSEFIPVKNDGSLLVMSGTVY